MEQNTVILTVQRYDELKELERVVNEGKETVFFNTYYDSVDSYNIYYNSQAHFIIMNSNESLKLKVEKLKALIKLKDEKIKELSKPKRKFLSKWF